MNLKGKRALVTGASSGIGAEFARLLGDRGVHLIITARRTERLEALASEIREKSGVEVDIISLDLSAPGAALSLYQQTEEAGKAVDILINNAGFGIQSFFADCPWENTHEQLRLNVVALSELTWRFMNVMKTRNGGYILNVASIGAYIPSPYYAAYTAGKAYVRNFTEAVSFEAKGTGVKITCLCPGPTDTEFLTRAGHKDLPAIGKLIFMSARRCAKIGLSGLFGWRVNVVSGLINKIMMLTLRLTPRWLMVRVGALAMGRHTRTEEPG